MYLSLDDEGLGCSRTCCGACRRRAAVRAGGGCGCSSCMARAGRSPSNGALGEWNPTRHGKYCGWGTACGKPDCGTPQDDMDACCRTHDRCYTDAGIDFVTSKFPSNRARALNCDRPFCECLKQAKADGLRARGYRWGAMKIFCP